MERTPALEKARRPLHNTDRKAAEQANPANAVAGPAPATGVVPLPEARSAKRAGAEARGSLSACADRDGPKGRCLWQRAPGLSSASGG